MQFVFHDGPLPGPPSTPKPEHLRTAAEKERQQQEFEMKTFNSFASFNEDEDKAFAFRNPIGASKATGAKKEIG